MFKHMSVIVYTIRWYKRIVAFAMQLVASDGRETPKY